MVGRADLALSEEFFLEATWIEYALFEDRINSALVKSGGALSNTRPTIESKIKELESRCLTHAGLRSIGDFPELLDEVRQWKGVRNRLVHRMVEAAVRWDDVNDEANLLATDGRELFGRFSSAIMRLGKWHKKHSPS